MAQEIPIVNPELPRWLDQQPELTKFARSFDESARLQPKTGWVWNLAKWSANAAVTIGNVVYIPTTWTSDQVRSVIPHEVAGHVKQFRACGLHIHPKAGIPAFGLIYGLVFFPVLLDWARYRLELNAETKSWLFQLAQGLRTVSEIKDKAERFANQVGSSMYLWAIPRRWARWGFSRRADKTIKKFL